MTYYYSIFDVNKPILESNKEFQSNSPMGAVKQYLKLINEPYSKIKVDGSNYARIKAEPFIIRDGTKYYATEKRAMWYSVIN